MPMHDTNDMRRRLRHADELPRPKLINDIQPKLLRERRQFPGLGTTLTSSRALPPRPPLATVSATPPVLASPDIPAPAAPLPAFRPAVAKEKKRRRIFTWRRAIAVLVLLLVVTGCWVGAKVLYNTAQVFHGSFFSVLSTTKLKGESTGRVNFLIAGNSADDPGHNGANLTDSIMVVSIDVKNNTAFMISVPRDLWVSIPGYGHAKINEAYVDGETGHFSTPGYPRGGMGLLAQVIQQNFDIPINYYGLIDYRALRDAVNAVGGITVNVHSDDPRGLYDPSIDWSTHGPLVLLKNGPQHLDGEQALDLARARGDAYGSYGFPRSDFDRTEHQREMLLALKSKIISAGVLANPLRVSSLFDSLGRNVKTNIMLNEVKRLYEIGKGISNTSIQSVGLNDAHGVNLLSNYRSPTGQSALIPAAGIDDFSQIKLFLKRLMTDNPVVKEGAKVVVLNGTTVDGLAGQAQTTLTAKDILVSAIGDAKTHTKTTMIIDASAGKKPATLATLKAVYAKASVATTNPYNGVYDADFIVVLGNDAATTP